MVSIKPTYRFLSIRHYFDHSIHIIELVLQKRSHTIDPELSFHVFLPEQQTFQFVIIDHQLLLFFLIAAFQTLVARQFYILLVLDTKSLLLDFFSFFDINVSGCIFFQYLGLGFLLALSIFIFLSLFTFDNCTIMRFNQFKIFDTFYILTHIDMTFDLVHQQCPF